MTTYMLWLTQQPTAVLRALREAQERAESGASHGAHPCTGSPALTRRIIVATVRSHGAATMTVSGSIESDELSTGVHRIPRVVTGS